MFLHSHKNIEKGLAFFRVLVYNNNCVEKRICGFPSRREVAGGASGCGCLRIRFLSIRRKPRVRPLIGGKAADFFCNLGGTTESLRPISGGETLFYFDNIFKENLYD